MPVGINHNSDGNLTKFVQYKVWEDDEHSRLTRQPLKIMNNLSSENSDLEG
jgi:hypothetical protein